MINYYLPLKLVDLSPSHIPNFLILILYIIYFISKSYLIIYLNCLATNLSLFLFINYYFNQIIMFLKVNLINIISYLYYFFILLSHIFQY
jgi:hypothetical protein